MKDYLTHTYSDLIVDVDSPLLWVTLNRPQYSNSFSDQMISDLCRLLREADWDDDVRVVILTGAGKNFCAGGDVKAMEEKTGMFAGDTGGTQTQIHKGHPANSNNDRVPSDPRSSQWSTEPAIGAGCDLACMCDMRIGCRHSRFGETFAKLALVPGDGGAFFLQRVVGYAKAMELSLTGRIVTAEEALALGLLNTLVEEASLKEETEKIARMISGNSPVAVSMIKKAIRQARTAEISGHLDSGRRLSGHHPANGRSL